MVGGERFFEGDRPGPGGGRRTEVGRHEIERPRGAEGGVAIAAVGPPDAGAMHLDLAVDQARRRIGMADPGAAPVPGSQDHSRMAMRQQLAA